ncbi:hypothetical protein RQP46_008277 [Phenoliferia psychrophenolica]
MQPPPSLAAPPSYASAPATTAQRRGPRPLSSATARAPSPAHSTSTSAYEPNNDLVPIHGNPFARPEVPTSEAEYHWGEDAASTIVPDDSVSQMDRRFTGKRTLTGPRAPPPPVSPIPIHSLPEEDESYGWVDPNALGDDGTVVGPSGRQISSQSRGGGPQPPSAQLYYPDEDDDDREDVAAYRSSANLRASQSSSAALPLVGDAALPAGYEGGMGSEVKPYQGYAAVGRNESDDDEYSPYSRSRDADLERAVAGSSAGAGGTESASGIRAVGANLASAVSGSLTYVKSLRSGAGGRGGGGGGSSSPSSMQKDQFDRADEYGAYEGGNNTFPMQQLNKGYGGDVQPRSLGGQAPPTWRRLIYDSTPNEIRIEEHKRGLGVQARPWACWILSVIMIAVMIYELVKMSNITGSPIQTKPSFNVMIGPSGAVLINLGARFAGCMKYIANVTDIDWVCLADTNKATISSSEATCTMSQICGFGGFTDNKPDQSFRFFVPIFLHAGIVHIILNLLAQLVSSAQVERQMGTPKFLVMYIAAGIFGNVLGANFALVGQPSVGASGAIFGTHAAVLVDLVAHWGIEYRPKRKLVYLLLEIVVGLALGLVPGGFAIGLLFSILLLPIIHETKRHRIVFIVLRCLAIPGVIVLFVVLTKNFYTTDPAKACEWCRYLSCWPTSNNNHCKGTGLESTSSTGSMYFGSLVAFLLTLVPAFL